MNKLYISFLFLFVSLGSFAQPFILQNFDDLVSDDLAALIMGEQATVSNAHVQCPNDGGGLFFGASGLGFSNGIILTTGSTAVAFSPNTTGSATAGGGPGYSNLENSPWSYTGGTFNACVLEFDFVPTGDNLSINYIFGSEEYPEYVGSNYNDSFAIFLEGEPEFPADKPIQERNIAIIPDSDNIYVSINFLNLGSYNHLYIDNTGGEHIQYDGLTVPLPATATVTAGNTYRIKFAIADVADAAWDSGLFIALNTEEIPLYRAIDLQAFWDENENNLKDEEESPLFNQSFLVEPSNKLITTNSEGKVAMLLLEGDYQISFQENTLWDMTVPTIYDITIDEDTELPTYYFGLQPSRIISRVVPNLNSNPTRCNTKVTYYLDYSNTGTTVADGKITLEFDELMGFVEAYPQPDGVQDGILTWNFSELYPSHQNKIHINFQIPDFNSMGEILETEATVETYHEDQTILYTKSTTYDSEVRCSYDPNDKLARSNLLGQSEFAYIQDTILYTVRFQNTGNDTAFNIRIEDILDKKLDWTTFHPITASHDYRTELNRETGLVTFYFNDILLPDSTTNEPESHGFVMFGIASLPDLQDKSEVDNTASIFFDFNPPIITNTATLTLIEQVETNIETLNADYSIRVFPNPFSDYTTIEVSGLSAKGDYQLEVRDILGRKVRELDLKDGKVRLDRGDLASGLYLIRIIGEEENRRGLGSEKILIK